MTEEERRNARRRALRTAQVITLGLALGSAGCEETGAAYCRVFEETRYCCERTGGDWNAAAGVCQHPFAMPGPFVPCAVPSERRA